MCIVFLAISGKQIKNNGFKLVVASNRDEYFQRRTRPAHFWPSHPHILSGTDGDKTGTWLGISKAGHFGVLTNYRQACGMENPQNRSRGELLSNFLTSNEIPRKYIDRVRQSSNLYNGFNLIVGDVSSREPQFSYFCNREHKPMQQLESGIYGLSNRYLDFGWKKVVLGKEKFGTIVNSTCPLQDKIPQLMSLLQDTTIYPDDSNFMGPEDGSHTFSELLPLTAISPLVSTIPGEPPNYGTRTNTVILVDNEDNVTFVERTMVEPIDFETGITWKTNTFEFKLNTSEERPRGTETASRL